MYTVINEPIETTVNFTARAPRPTSFTWKNKTYTVKNLDLMFKAHEGKDLIYYFNVSTDSASYQLTLNTTTLDWNLKSVYSPVSQKRNYASF